MKIFFVLVTFILLFIINSLKGFSQEIETDFDQAFTFYNEGNYTKAAELFEKWLPVIREDYGVNDTAVFLRLLATIANCYYNSIQYEKAELYNIEVLRIAKESYGTHHPSYAIRLNNMAQLYQALGQYEKAEPLLIEALHIAKESHGGNHHSYAICMNNLASLYLTMGKYYPAETMMKEVIQIDKASLGEDHPDYAIDLNNLAQLYQAIGRFRQAEPLMIEAMRIHKESLGENHPTYCIDINNLAELYKAMGRYEQAEYLLKEALRIDKEFLGENHPSYGRDLINLASLYMTVGRYEQAELMMKEALRIDKSFLGENHPSYGRDLNNLALLYLDMGRYEKAEQLMFEALRITKTTLGEYHSEYATQLNNLASVYLAEDRFDQVEPLMKKALQINKGSLGENHPNYAISLNDLAQFYQAMRWHDKAEPLMKEAMRIDKESLGEKHPSYGRDLNNLASLYQSMGQFEQAEPLMEEAILIVKASFGENHLSMGYHLNNLAILYGKMGQFEKAMLLMKKAFKILKYNLTSTTGYLSEIELNQYQQKLFFQLEIYQSFNYFQSVSGFDIGEFAFDIELFQRGLLLKSVIETRKRILASGDSLLISNYLTMLELRKSADKLYEIPKENRFDDPVLLEENANQLEKGLQLRSKEYQQYTEEAGLTWQKVRARLQPTEAVVEYASFRYFNKQWTDSTLYCALVLRKQDTIPHMVYLFEEKQLAEVLPKQDNNSDASINNTYAVLRGGQLLPDPSLYKGKNLYNLVWNPLDSLLSGIKTVNFACSGLLNTVSFAAIPDTTGKLVCVKYALNQYSSTRNLAIETDELPVIDATIYGGIQYELDTTLMIANSRQYSKSNAFALAYNSTRSGNKRGEGFELLEGTREEANAINTLFKGKKITTNNYTGAAANEESFKAMATKKSPSVIHLSTHGFYYPDTVTQQKRTNELQFTSSDLNRFQYSPDPLLRSGIVLAGANRVWRGEPVPDGVEDGILTAKDVSQLDLRNTQLVVLSACQTGLGDVKGSEGVFGLQRAFKMAGVRYLIMSLWSVPDKETKEFMEKFYTHWLTGIPIRSAFQTTQQDMRLQYPQDPYKWAAFVLVE